MHNFQYLNRSNILSSEGIAATSHHLATLEAISILKIGGNAIDAAIAASAVLSVVEPNATGIGGDCFSIVAINGKNPISYNGSGINPEKASLKFFNDKKIESIHLESPHSVTVPGAINAWGDMHKDYGKLDFEQLFKKAIHYAENGFNITEKVAKSWEVNTVKLLKNKNSKKNFLKDGKSYKFSEKYSNQNLANTLKRISKKGPSEFYNGETTYDIVQSLNQLGGVHTLEDFYKQKTIKEETIKSSYKDIMLNQCPPNGPGITVLLMMKMAEELNIAKYDPMSFERFHIEAEITKFCYKIREDNIGDPNFININLNNILSNGMIKDSISKISMNKCSELGNLNIPAHPETTYLTVIDKDLNSVSFINSICYAFGSGICTNNTGILMQNRGVNFRLESNHPNCIDSLKRPLHTIIPGMVLDNKDRVILSYGVMGGQYQPVGHVHVLNNIFDYNMSVQEAIDFPRAFYYNGNYDLESSIQNKIQNKLDAIGYNTRKIESFHGGGQAIKIDYDNGVLIGGSDFRKDGCAIGL